MKKIVVLLLTLSLMFMLVACGDKETGKKESPKDTKTTKVTKEETTEAVSEATTEAKSEEKVTEATEAAETTTEAKSTEAATESTTSSNDTAVDNTNTTEATTTSQSSGRSMTVYYEDGAEETVTEDSDGTWVTAKGAKYYLGEDGILRAKGYTDLYTFPPAPDDTSDSSSQLSKVTIPAYAADGSTVYITYQDDGTWTTDSGAVYYEGEDGVFRAKGNQDLYKDNPAGQ